MGRKPLGYYSIRAPKVGSRILNRTNILDFMAYKNDGYFPPADIVGVVSSSSPLSVRRAAVELATYFKHEFHYDFLQFAETPEGSHERDRAFLYSHGLFLGGRPIASNIPLVGCCSFRWRENDEPPGYALQWAWFHPYFRRQGLLTRSWRYFTDRFGRFRVEEPLSLAMKAFLDKHARKD